MIRAEQADTASIGTRSGACGRTFARVSSVRWGTQPVSCGGAPAEEAAGGIPRIAARRSAGGGSRRRRGIPAG